MLYLPLPQEKAGSSFYLRMDQLRQLIQWDTDQLMMFGSLVITRRKAAWISSYRLASHIYNI